MTRALFTVPRTATDAATLILALYRRTLSIKYGAT